MVIELRLVQIWSKIIVVISKRTSAQREFDFEIMRMISGLIIYMKKFLHFDWLRAVQFFSKTVQKRVNSVQKKETNQAF